MKRVLKALGQFLAMLAITFGLVFMVGFEKVWRFAGPADLGPVVWEGLSKTKKPNQALVCPKGLCNDAHMDRESPVYGVDVATLKTALLKMVNEERATERVDDLASETELRFVTYSARLRFPDTTRVRLIALDDKRSTIALYAQSQIGTSDLGVNFARLKRWLKKLQPLEEAQS